MSHYVSYSLGKCTSTASASLRFFLNSWDQKVIRHIILSLHTAHCSLPHSLKFHAEKGQGRASLSFPPSSSPDGRWDIELRLALVCPWGLGRRDQQLMVMQCTVISEGIQFSSKFVFCFFPLKNERICTYMIYYCKEPTWKRFQIIFCTQCGSKGVDMRTKQNISVLWSDCTRKQNAV